MAPMATHFATEKGEVTQKLIDYYVERGKGQVGLIVSESNYISLEGRGGAKRLGLYCDELIDGHEKLTSAVHKTGTKICAQLSHVGRYASPEVIGQYPLSCSTTILLGRGAPFLGIIPRKLKIEEIRDIIRSFGLAGRRAKESGYDAVMLHGASGYLINQFLSSYTNTRDDIYGKGFEGRIRFLLEVIAGLRKDVGTDFPIMVRLVADEKVRGGYGFEYIKRVAQRLESAGVAEINLTLGNNEAIEWSPGGLYFPQGYLAEYSKALKEKVKIPIGIVGRIRDIEVAERIITQKKADLIYLGRCLIADPLLPRKSSEGKFKEIRGCIACNRGCISNVYKGVEIACTINPELGKEGE
jgi:NADH:flavin oxidoreductases, Old Yellow Enzyme family